MNGKLTAGLAVVLLLTAASCYVETYPDRTVTRPPLPPPPPRPPIGYDVGLFYDDLDPYGEWIFVSPYGWVFAPAGVHPDWRPYSDGRWLYTDDGWMWDTDEPWGWASYHYGRWFYQPRHGWCWVPGAEWGPSWVVWRSGDGWLGWAPMPPGVAFRAGIGLDFGGIDINVVIQPFMWHFVPERYAFEPRIGGYIAPVGRNVTIVHVTQTVTNYVVVNNRVMNRGVEVERIERSIGRPATRYRVVDSDTRGRPVVTREKEVHVFRQPLKPASQEHRPARGRVVEDDRATERPIEPKVSRLPAKPPSESAGAASRPASPDLAAYEERRKREAMERSELEKRIQAQREALVRAQAQDTKSRPPLESEAEKLRQRHRAEQQALDEDARRARELLKSRQDERGKGSQGKTQQQPQQQQQQQKKKKAQKKEAEKTADERQPERK